MDDENKSSDAEIDLSNVDISIDDPLMSTMSTTIPSSWTGGAVGSTASSFYGNVTISTSNFNGTSSLWNSPQYIVSNGNLGIGTSSLSSGLHVTDDAEFEGDIRWKGRSLGKLLEKIEDRLAILSEPDPEKLEKFAALKKAYEHYKLMEKLIGDE